MVDGEGLRSNSTVEIRRALEAHAAGSALSHRGVGRGAVRLMGRWQPELKSTRRFKGVAWGPHLSDLKLYRWR